MQNGAIWNHFRVSYNIESSTILMIDRQEFLKLVQNLPFVFKISVNMHQSKGRADPEPFPFKIMAYTLLSLSYAPDVNFEPTTPFLSDQKNLTLSLNFVG
jgi:hypothetical protein